MRVALSINPYAVAGGGSVSFARVLAEFLPQHGVEVTFDPAARCDCVLVFAQHVRLWTLRWQWWRGARIVHRVDERRDPRESGFRRRKHRMVARINALADVTIFQSRFVQENMGPICSAPRAVVVHNGVDRTIFSPKGPRPSLDGAPRILHVSWSVGASKRLDRIHELLQAAGAETRLYLIGRHAESGLQVLDEPQVRMLGPQPRETVAALMRACDFLFFPSELEPCPNTVIEAMACGLPILYHPSGGTPELVGDAGVPLSDSLEEDVMKVMAATHGLRRRALVRAAEFSAERVSARYAEVVREVLKERSEGHTLISSKGV